ncbi:hypothetical protein Anapl_09382 [Anas platyrhynchos]|uniref:Uncharacterized protein n=1 Tax=Anas platyrhynchos TaxID=8839 RepID=R0M1P1_ANAPL|nr:hypothetical protein Anapl_09382 [Anas platyrhynchos]
MHNADRSGGSGQAPTERAVPKPGLPVSPVSGDRIELFVQTMAKLQKSGWQETTTELVRRRSTTIAADWMKVKAASATPHGLLCHAHGTRSTSSTPPPQCPKHRPEVLAADGFARRHMPKTPSHVKKKQQGSVKIQHTAWSRFSAGSEELETSKAMGQTSSTIPTSFICMGLINSSPVQGLVLLLPYVKPADRDFRKEVSYSQFQRITANAYCEQQCCEATDQTWWENQSKEMHKKEFIFKLPGTSESHPCEAKLTYSDVSNEQDVKTASGRKKKGR